MVTLRDPYTFLNIVCQIYIFSISFEIKELDRSVRGIYSYCVGEQPDPMVKMFNYNETLNQIVDIFFG